MTEPDPAMIHLADQMWAEGSNHLDRILAYVKSQEAAVYRSAGNDDASVLFDFMKGFIMKAEEDHPEEWRASTIFVAAAAITRLVRAPRTVSNPILAQLDKEIDNS